MFKATYRGTNLEGKLQSFAGGDGTTELRLEFDGGLNVEIMNPNPAAVKVMNAIGRAGLKNANVNFDTGLISSDNI